MNSHLSERTANMESYNVTLLTLYTFSKSHLNSSIKIVLENTHVQV